MSDGKVQIHDKDAFPSKIAAIRTAEAELRAAAGALNAIAETASTEASSFTADRTVAPVYRPLLAGISEWIGAATAAVGSVCDSAENCAATAEAKFTAITTTDSAAAAAVAST